MTPQRRPGPGDSAVAPQVDIVAQPNVSIVDVTTVAEGGSFDTPEFLAAMEEYGTGATVLTEPPLDEAARAGGGGGAADASSASGSRSLRGVGDEQGVE